MDDSAFRLCAHGLLAATNKIVRAEKRRCFWCGKARCAPDCSLDVLLASGPEGDGCRNQTYRVVPLGEAHDGSFDVVGPDGAVLAHAVRKENAERFRDSMRDAWTRGHDAGKRTARREAKSLRAPVQPRCAKCGKSVDLFTTKHGLLCAVCRDSTP